MKISKSPLTKKNKTEEITTTTDLIKFFVIFFIISMFICVVLAAMSGGESWKLQLFHSNGYTDMFMDFFNSMRDANASNVYTARNNIYPPLALLIFKFFNVFVSDELLVLPNAKRTSLQYDQNCMIIYFIFAIVCILLMTQIINKYAENIRSKQQKKSTTSYSILSFMMIVSYPVMYCIERGNIIILSVIFTMFFVFFKDSDSKLIKELSYISLAIAAGIKLYPAIFGIILIIEKKYKDAVRLIIYGIIFVIFPFIFFMDFDSNTLSVSAQTVTASVANSHTASQIAESSSPIINIIENLISFATKKKNSLNLSSVSIQNFVFLIDKDNDTFAKILCLITEFIAVATLLFTKKAWQKVFLITYLMLNIPSASSSYALSFIIIPFFMFLYDDKGNGYPANDRQKIDWAYIVCYALLLTPLPMFWYYYQPQANEFFNSLGIANQTRANQVIATFVFQLMFFIIVTEIAFKLIKIRRKKLSVTSDSSVSEGYDCSINKDNNSDKNVIDNSCAITDNINEESL